MNIIKFRATHAATGKPVFFDAETFFNELPIDRNSLQQFIATDDNGKDIYEGDLVKRIKTWDDDESCYISCDSRPFNADFSDLNAIELGEIIRI